MSRIATEARAWIKRAAGTVQFAPARFASPEAALDFVYKIYRAGAVEVSVIDDGAALNVALPADAELRAHVIEVCNLERERAGAATLADTGQSDVVLTWDGVPA